MQISIAVCDDEQVICSKIENTLITVFDDLSIKYEIDIFLSGESLCNELKRSRYDLIFLDIELPKMNGIKVGRYIRETLKDEIVQIAYISSKQEYAMELFDYRPINFLVKPLQEEQVKKVIKKYLLISEQDNQMLTYKKGYEFFRIPMSDILYFINNNRKVTVVTKDGRDEFYASMENIYGEVKSHKFLFIHKSIIVNYNFVTKFGYTEVVMADGEVFPVSQSRRKNIRMAYMDIKKGEE